MKTEDRPKREDYLIMAGAGLCIGLPFGAGVYLGWAFIRGLIRFLGA